MVHHTASPINKVTDNSEESKEDSLQDFFSLILHSKVQDAEGEVQQQVEELGALPVGEGDYLKPCKDEPVLIIGYPEAGGPETGAPMRLDWGKESHQNWGLDQALVKERILYDLMTLGGNSGSPVFGRGGKVKGIRHWTRCEQSTDYGPQRLGHQTKDQQ